MSRDALVREHQQANSAATQGRTRWGPVHVYRRRLGGVMLDSLAVWFAGLASDVRRGRLLAALALLAAAGAVIALVLSALSPGAPPTRPSAARNAGIARSSVSGAAARRGPASPSRHVSQPAAEATSSAQAPPSSTAQSASHQPESQRVSPAAATQLEARGHDLLRAGHYGAAVPVLQRAVATTGEQNGGCLEPTDQNCLTYAFALYDLGRALRLSGHPGAAVPILERRLRIDNQREAVAAELLLALSGNTG